jgi:hypothetical protein
MRKYIAFLLVRIAFRVMPESKSVKEFTQYLATTAMIDGGYIKIVKPEELYKETQDASTKTKTETNNKFTKYNG